MSSLFQTKYDEDQSSVSSGSPSLFKTATGLAAGGVVAGASGATGVGLYNWVAGYCSGDKKKKKNKKKGKED